MPKAEGAARLMALALGLARRAAKLDEVPVGALIVRGPLDAARPEIVARAHNRTERDHDASAHAELLAIRRAAKKLGRWRLSDCSLVVTLEPCAMCAGAAVWSRLREVVYAAPDPKAGACGSVLQVAQNSALNHRVKVTQGPGREESSALLKEFFKTKRAAKKGKA